MQTHWTKTIKDKQNNIYQWTATLQGIETIIQDRPVVSTKDWHIIFKAGDDSKKLKITHNAIYFIRKLEKNEDVVEYLKKFAFYYLKKFDFDFTKIRSLDIIKSTQPRLLPSISTIEKDQ